MAELRTTRRQVKGGGIHRYSLWIVLAGVLTVSVGVQQADCRSAQAAQDANSARLAITGEDVLSLTLEDGSGRVIALVASEDVRAIGFRSASVDPRLVTDKILLPPRGGTLPLAPGRYRWDSIIVAEPNCPLRFTATNQRRDWFTLSAGRTTALTLGGPLRQHLSVSRCGPVLDCAYQLSGAGGESYLPTVAQSPAQPSQQPKAPELTILKDGRKIHAGSFRYG